MLFDELTNMLFDGCVSTPVERSYMKTDVIDAGDHTEFIADLPGYRKEDISAKIDKGLLTIEASVSTENEEKCEDGKYLRRERYKGSCSRSFYVGKEVKPEHVSAAFKDGVLTVKVSKPEPKVTPEEDKIIPIMG